VEIFADVKVSITDAQVQRIFRGELDRLTEDYWIIEESDAKKWVQQKAGIYKTLDMQGRGSDIDEWVAELDDPKFVIQVAACRLENLLKAARK